MCRVEENECDRILVGPQLSVQVILISRMEPLASTRSHVVERAARSRTMQCQNIFGANAQGSSSNYDAVNVIGDQYGNCGILGVHDYDSVPKIYVAEQIV